MSSSNQHWPKVIDDVSLPYATNINIASRVTSPFYVGGQNVLVQSSSPITRRPGFLVFNPKDFTPGVVVRYFTWRRWNSSFFVIACSVDTVGLTSKVWKCEIGVDPTFLHIFSDNASANPFDFVVSNNFIFFGNGFFVKKWDGTTLSDWGSPGSPTAPTLVNAAAGNVPSAIGHKYVYWGGNSVTAFATDISPESAVTGTPNRQWDVTGDRFGDTYIDEVHIARTEDGGGVYYELSNSPITNPGTPTWTLRDNDYDVTQVSTPRLTSVQAPFKSVNNQPPAVIGMKYFAGRIWGFNGDTVYFSGLEEVNNGVPEESWGTAVTNSQSFGVEIMGLEVLGNSDTAILLVFTPATIFFISGSSLATFRIGFFSKIRGTRNRQTIVAGETEDLGPFVAWLDTSNTVRLASTRIGIRDISFDIRPDLVGINHDQASMTIHQDGLYQWMLLCDGGASKIRPFDLDRMKWMPPWPISDITVIHSGETSVGVHTLFLGKDTRPFSMNYGQFTDDGTAYDANVILALTSLLDDTRPEQVAVVEYVGIERNSQDIADIEYLLDEDPLTGSPTYTSIKANEVDPFLRSTVDSPFSPTHTSGVNLVEKWYYLRDKAGSRRVAIKLSWPAEDADFKFYSAAVVSSRQGDS